MIQEREIEVDKIFVRKTYVYEDPIEIKKGLLDTYDPPTVESRNYKNRIAMLDLRTYADCRSRHGQVYHIGDIVDPNPPLHQRCRCEIKIMNAVYAGDSTKNGKIRSRQDVYKRHL